MSDIADEVWACPRCGTCCTGGWHGFTEDEVRAAFTAWFRSLFNPNPTDAEPPTFWCNGLIAALRQRRET